MRRYIGDRRLTDDEVGQPATKGDLSRLQSMVVSGTTANWWTIVIVGLILAAHIFFPEMFGPIREALK
jgi:hypothetical protein